jgi:hypothetical protein
MTLWLPTMFQHASHWRDHGPIWYRAGDLAVPVTGLTDLSLPRRPNMTHYLGDPVKEDCSASPAIPL